AREGAGVRGRQVGERAVHERDGGRRGDDHDHRERSERDPDAARVRAPCPRLRPRGRAARGVVGPATTARLRHSGSPPV
ncbi:MAG: hypothetical protein AVDCRST_MAG40-3132, partial [uncultured Gemmatimonadaceae bacterium]